MDISISFPLDRDGFLRRECPSCERQFKWHHGPANAEAEAEASNGFYYCPLCGEPAKSDYWWTQEQIDFIQRTALPAATRTIESELKDAFKRVSSKRVRFQAKGSFETPEVPDSLTEPDDMNILTSPCHSFEPIKVPEDTTPPYHCFICGEAFAV